MKQLRRALFISKKDFESYYSKPPLITWGLLLPAVLILAVYLKEPRKYLQIAPGVIAMTLLFGNTSMSAIVITFEKRSGTLVRLLLAPLRKETIILGKMTSAGLYGIATALILTTGLMSLLGLRIQHLPLFMLGLLLGAVVFSLFGLLASVMVKEVFEAMTLMNFFRFPLLFVSGVFMPVEHFPAVLKPVVLASPLTYVVELLRLGITGEGYFSSPLLPVVATLIFAGIGWFCTAKNWRRVLL
ncbi:MAG: ABC transporter permease [Deltaproteobacteria bacterium]|nr:ABC transporter permease [Deltaproteobacteria bacterium]MBW2070906.1 ABC transporter permease [Deltaproteobacteria bacterium]